MDSMDPARYQLIKDIVLEAIESDDVEAILQKRCGDDAALRQEVEELLNVDVGESFLANSPVQLDLPENEPEKIGGHIGKIRIDELIAHGGMGDVYAGVNEVLERPVAIKIIKSSLRFSAARRSAFLNEAKLLSSLQHPNICQVYDFFEDHDRDVLVLELIRGQTLRERLQQDSVNNKLEVLQQICAALVAAHERGISHHDLKPENVMITSSGEVKVLDFGLAKNEQPKSHATANDDGGPSTAIAGTPGYMSPEQARGETSSSASDVWSLGIIAFELFTGNKPFPKDLSTIELIDRTRSGNLDLAFNLPAAESQLLNAMLSMEAENRPSAREVLSQLNGIERRPKRRLAIALAASVVVAALLGTFKYTTDLQAEQALAEAARLDAESLVAFMLDDLNTGLQSVGRLDLLESVANETMAYYGELSLEQMQTSQGNAAVSMVRLAEVLDLQGRKEDALKLLNPALDALQILRETAPDDEVVIYQFGNADMVAANIHKVSGDFEAAHRHSKRAIASGRTLTAGLAPGESPTANPSANERWRLLLRSLYLDADVSMRLGDRSVAANILEDAIALAIPAVAAEPLLNSTLADIQFKRCDTYYDMADDELALQSCLAVMELDEDLYAANPDNYQLRSNFALDHVTVARAYGNLELFDEALTTAELGELHFRELAEWEGANSSTLNDLAQLLATKARLLYQQGNIESSLAVFNEAHDILEPLTEDREEITYLNNNFVILLHLGRIEEARELASLLHSRGFRRRDFLDLCEEFQISECQI